MVESRLFQEQKEAGPDLEKEGVMTDEAGDGGSSRGRGRPRRPK